MGDAKCRSCDLAAEAGAYCSGCAAHSMAKALNPFFGGRRKKSAGRGDAQAREACSSTAALQVALA